MTPPTIKKDLRKLTRFIQNFVEFLLNLSQEIGTLTTITLLGCCMALGWRQAEMFPETKGYDNKYSSLDIF